MFFLLKNNSFQEKDALLYFTYLQYRLKEKVIFARKQEGHFVKIRPKIDEVSDFKNWVFKRSFSKGDAEIVLQDPLHI